MEDKPKRIPYQRALECLYIPKALKITKSSENITVAVIDLGYSHHVKMDGRLWEKDIPGFKTVNGWDAFADDYTLEYDNPLNDYHKGHHVFVAGEVANAAPKCKIMPVKIGYGNPDCWSKAVRFAVDNNAKIIVMPHGYLNGERQYGKSLFELGGDFAFPYDNYELIEALDYAHDNDCMVFSGTCDNRGRRVAYYTGIEAVTAVGSSNLHNMPADICDSADYVDLAAPSGQRNADKNEHIYGYGGDNNYIYFTGGCMASGFAAGVAALVRSRFPKLNCDQIKQIMMNTAYMPEGMNVNKQGKSDLLGFGIINAYKAVALKREQICKNVNIKAAKIKGNSIHFTLKNTGVFDSQKTLITAFNGNPTVPLKKPDGKYYPSMTVRQINHTILKVRGLHEISDKMNIDKSLLYEDKDLWLEAYSLDKHSGGCVSRFKIPRNG